MKPLPDIRHRRIRRIAVTAALALTLGLGALAAPASGAAVPASGAAASGGAASGATRAAATASCPWLDQSLPVSQRVSMLMAQ
ncbi:MAG TPA: hypothetical protein VF482_19930, partial [Trebonia sp.]